MLLSPTTEQFLPLAYDRTADASKAGSMCVDRHAPRRGENSIGRVRINYLQIVALDLLTDTITHTILWDPTQPTATVTTTYTYTPYGTVTTEGDITQPIQWSSEYHDPELALVYYNYRYYNPTDGRWTRRDPIGIEGGVNIYEYSLNRPSDTADFLGNLGVPNMQCKCIITFTIERDSTSTTEYATTGTFEMNARRECRRGTTQIKHQYEKIKGVTLEPRKGTYRMAEGRIVKNYPIPGGRKYNIGYYVGKNNPRAFELKGVPGFSEILIHAGSYAFHTEGCIMVGVSISDGFTRVGPREEAYEAMKKAQIFEEGANGLIKTAILYGSAEVLRKIMKVYDECTQGDVKLSEKESYVSIN